METHYLVTILILAAICLAFVIARSLARKKREDQKEVPMDTKEPDTTQLPSEPDEVIILDPTRANELNGAVHLYRKEGFLAFGTGLIPIDRIKDISISNASNPYHPCAYYIHLKLNDGRVAHIPAGQDAEWANDVLIQLRDAIFSGEPE